MPWYAWLIIVLALGSIVGGLLLLRDSAKKLPLSEDSSNASMNATPSWTRRRRRTAEPIGLPAGH